MRLIPPPSSADEANLRAACARLYQAKVGDVRVVHAPYRLCPLGAHIDHQSGPVSAFATAHGVRLAYVLRADGKVLLQSRDFAGVAQLDPGGQQQRKGDWADYARGAIKILNDVSPLTQGVGVLIEGQLAEAGLSSSAAIGLGYLAVLADANNITLSAEAMVDLDCHIENDFMGVRNGALDPAAIAFSVAGRLTVVDCKTMAFETLASPAPFRFVAVYSGMREALASSPKFNNRVAECLEAGRTLRNLVGDPTAMPQPIGNTSRAEWESVRAQLEGVPARRTTHFFTESERVRAGASAWRNGDLAAFGALMTESAHSSINNYETGSNELIHLFEALGATRGVLGARFCGAGFRGACIALIDRSDSETIIAEALARYLKRYPHFAEAVWAIEAVPSRGLTRL